MDEMLSMTLYTLGAGACILLGGLLAYKENIRPAWLETEFRHFVIAFGGGILVAAVALVLVPEGRAYVAQPLLTVALVLAGGLLFFAAERRLGSRRQQKPQLMAMLLDYVPESLALGAAFAVGAASAPLLAVFIALQNVPEGFNLNPAVDRLCLWKEPINSKCYRFLNAHQKGDHATRVRVCTAGCLAALQILAIPPVSTAVCALPARPPHPL